MLTRGWNPDYDAQMVWRLHRLERMREDPEELKRAHQYYAEHPVDFINDWVDTIDPRNVAIAGKVRIPLLLFPRQVRLVRFIDSCLKAETSGLVEKSRDMGATWVACGYSIWLWLFKPGVAVGWGSRKAMFVDRIGDPDSIFEKMRRLIGALPVEFRPIHWEGGEMKLINHENGATITGEGGDQIGRGGRKTIFFLDEAAHVEHPELIEASLSENTRVRIDISSVNGTGNVFHRKREAGIDWEPGTEMRSGRTYVFVMDWRDHPHKTQAWYDQRRQKFVDDGLLHVFRQEVDRDYGASLANSIIAREWVLSAIDAHRKLGLELDEGGYVAGLDVADGGGDRNALVVRKGVVLKLAEEWGERDTGITARRAVDLCREFAPIEVQYDCIGVGSGVKAETNRLLDEKIMPRGIEFVPWDAGSAVLKPDDHVVEDDGQSPINKDFYGNLKAQGWWALRRRFELTHRAITEGIKVSADDMISLSSGLPRLRQLEKELCQVTVTFSGRMRLLIEKTPEGTRSPNLASVFGRILVRDPIHDAVSEGDAIDGLGKTPIIDQVGKPSHPDGAAVRRRDPRLGQGRMAR